MILFLDFDGVLHPEGPCEPFCRLPLLEAWLRRRTDVDVVISSSWREETPFEALVCRFSPDLRDRIVGCTPLYREVFANPFALQPMREAECRRWMSDSWDPGRPWAAVDDMAELFSRGCDRLVLCDPRVGLTAQTLKALNAPALRRRSQA